MSSMKRACPLRKRSPPSFRAREPTYTAIDLVYNMTPVGEWRTVSSDLAVWM